MLDIVFCLRYTLYALRLGMSLLPYSVYCVSYWHAYQDRLYF
jgi:hypothetical protein